MLEKGFGTKGEMKRCGNKFGLPLSRLTQIADITFFSPPFLSTLLSSTGYACLFCLISFSSSSSSLFTLPWTSSWLSFNFFTVVSQSLTISDTPNFDFQFSFLLRMSVLVFSWRGKQKRGEKQKTEKKGFGSRPTDSSSSFFFWYMVHQKRQSNPDKKSYDIRVFDFLTEKK